MHSLSRGISKRIELQLFKIIIIVYLVACGIDFTSALLVELFTPSTAVDGQRMGVLLSKYLLSYGSKLLFFMIAIIATRPLIRNPRLKWRTIPLHLALAFLLSFFTALTVLLVNRYLFLELPEITLESLWIRGLYGLSFNFFVYLALIAVVYAYDYIKENERAEVAKEKLKAQLLDAKINALQSQLQPHFLFNALNDISSLMSMDVPKAQNAVADLSTLLRKTLQLKNQKLIPLAEEMNLLQSYLDLEQLRYGEKLHTSVELDTEIMHALVPPLILQPLFENAIKHGLKGINKRLKVSIRITKKDSQLEIVITNDGMPLPKHKGITYGNGITNLLERMQTIYGNPFEFSLENQETQGTQSVTVILCVPFCT